ncbi:isopeptide-forming domain-containing fimbrial protein [Thiolapillus sp.]|uniref:isopeptide-forming domain-containing fimbrial protein n=1 Tax=Thiolapillus sp. TaxID=2017437 RepID=UPI003AF4D824
MTRTAGARIGCQRPSRFWGLGCPKIYHEVEDTLVTNTGSATWTSQPGATAFPPVTDTATVTVTVSEPSLAKTTAATSATIGDVFPYTLTLTIPEGTSSSVTLHDVLDPGLAFVDLGTNASISASAGLSTSPEISPPHWK